jgi:TonB family protein
MLAFAVKSTIILALAALGALGLRRRSAAARHLVWTAAATALLALPLFAWLLPALRMPVPRNGPTALFQVFVTSTPLSHVGQASRPAADLKVRPAAAPIPLLPTLWAAGTAIGLLQLAGAWFVLWRLRRNARRLPAAPHLTASLGIRYDVPILEMARGSMPMTCGIFRPAVLLPAGASQWSAERLRVVLLHELAHVRRADVATHLLARTALCLHWWNPLAWYGWSEFVKQRERATDDLVLSVGERASDYAGHLLEIARSFRPEPATAWAALAMARRNELEGRLVAILDSNVSRHPAGIRAAVAAALAALAVCAPFAALQAQDAAAPPSVNIRVTAQADGGIAADVDATIRAAQSQRNYEMLDRAAATFEKLRQFEFARKLRESSLVLRGEAGGTTGAVYAAGLVNLGDLAKLSDRPDEMDAFYRRAVALGDRPEVAKALRYLAVTALSAQDPAAAQDYSERLLKVQPDGPDAAEALAWLAAIRDHQPGGDAQAESLYQRALAMSQPPMDRAALFIRYAEFLRRHDRLPEAEQMQARAADLQTEGRKQAAANFPPASPGVYRVGNGVTPPRLIYKVEPQYTEEARTAKYQGTVLLYVEVQPDGRASHIRVARALGLGLDERAIEAVRQWRFTPGTKEGQPVPVAATIEVNFRLL